VNIEVFVLGDVAIIYRVMPESVEVDLDKVQNGIREAIPEGAKLEGMMLKDIAFGIRAIVMRVRMPDKVGGGIPDLIEDRVQAIEGVASIEVLEQTLVS
jgi:elongation factor 1-beta